MTLLYVGADKTYQTISSAVTQASGGDTVLIDQGMYTESIYLDNKAVNLVGNYPYAEDAVVVVSGTSATYGALRLRWTSSDLQEINIEGLTLVRSGYPSPSTGVVCVNIGETNDSGLKLILNKCTIDATRVNSTNNVIVQVGEANGTTITPADTIQLINCDLTLENNNFIQNHFPYIPNTAIIHCRFDSEPGDIYWDGEWQSPLGVIKTTRIDINREFYLYGPKYERYLTEFSGPYTFSGTITENNSPVSRQIRAFRESNDTYVSTCVSSGTTGGYVLPVQFNVPHYLVCLDDPVATPVYNDLIQSDYYPTTTS